MSKFCTNCGSEMEDSAKFCPKCGTPAQTGKNGLNCKNYGTHKHRSFLFYVLFYVFSFTGISKSICLTSRFPDCAKLKHEAFQFYPNVVRKRVVSDIVRTMAPSVGRYFGLRPRTAKLNNPET